MYKWFKYNINYQSLSNFLYLYIAKQSALVLSELVKYFYPNDMFYHINPKYTENLLCKSIYIFLIKMPQVGIPKRFLCLYISPRNGEKMFFCRVIIFYIRTQLSIISVVWLFNLKEHFTVAFIVDNMSVLQRVDTVINHCQNPQTNQDFYLGFLSTLEKYFSSACPQLPAFSMMPGFC